MPSVVLITQLTAQAHRRTHDPSRLTNAYRRDSAASPPTYHPIHRLCVPLSGPRNPGVSRRQSASRPAVSQTCRHRRARHPVHVSPRRGLPHHPVSRRALCRDRAPHGTSTSGTPSPASGNCTGAHARTSTPQSTRHTDGPLGRGNPWLQLLWVQ